MHPKNPIQKEKKSHTSEEIEANENFMCENAQISRSFTLTVRSTTNCDGKNSKIIILLKFFSSLVSGLGLGKFSRPRRDRDRDFPGSLGLDFVIGKA